MAEQMLSPGDVLGFPIERIGRFGACQVVAADVENQKVTVALLDWTGEQMPTLGDVTDAPRLEKNFMFWKAQEMVKNVQLPAPSRFRAIGKLPVRGTTESRSYGGWEFDNDVARQRWWNMLPTELTAAFKASLDSDGTVSIPGLQSEHSGEPMQMRVGTGRSGDDAAYRITSDFRMGSLQAWPALYQVYLHAWREDLVPFLRSAPLVSELSLLEHGQREIDLSGTHLDRLVIDIDGLERLVLPKSMNTLVVHGNGAVNTFGSTDAPLRLQVTAEQRGRWISVQAAGAVPALHGLDQARGLRMDKVSRLDLDDAACTFPNIEYLHLFGSPGTLTGLASLSKLPKLESLWLCDLFGYAAHEFPAPGTLAALTSLSLDSLPAEVAAAVRKAYKKVPRVDLSVSKPRKPEWLAENLDNPLRHWDGREGIPAAAVKKTHTAYVAALRQVREAGAARVGDAAYADVVTRAISDFLEVIAGLNRKNRFLDTLERDEVIDAVNMLTAQLSAPARAALDPLVEDALDD